MDFSFAKVLQIYLERWPWFLGMIGQQLFISLVSIAIAGTLGLLIGIFIAEHRRFAEPVIAVCNVFYTIPAIALIALALLSPQVFRITRAELAKLEEKRGALGVDKGERF